MRLCLLVCLPTRSAWFAILLFLSCGVFTAPLRAQNPSSGLVTLGFDNDVGPGNPDVTGLQIGPWMFASQKFHTVSLSDAGLLRFANNGTPFIASVGGGLDHPITLERLDGSPFSLVSLDVAEGFLDDILAADEGFVSATRLEVEAALTSGFTLTLEFDLDGLRDGLDGVDDFESFSMPDELKSVTSVTFSGLAGGRRDAGFALDDVTVAAVIPEPATGTLLAAAGVFALVAALRKRMVALPGKSPPARGR